MLVGTIMWTGENILPIEWDAHPHWIVLFSRVLNLILVDNSVSSFCYTAPFHDVTTDKAACNGCRIERLELFDEFEEWYMMQVYDPLEKYCTAHCFVKLSVFLHLKLSTSAFRNTTVWPMESTMPRLVDFIWFLWNLNASVQSNPPAYNSVSRLNLVFSISGHIWQFWF